MQKEYLLICLSYRFSKILEESSNNFGETTHRRGKWWVIFDSSFLESSINAYLIGSNFANGFDIHPFAHFEIIVSCTFENIELRQELFILDLNNHAIFISFTVL